MKTFTLNDGNIIPSLGLGTWKSQQESAYRAVKEALRIGYRHIDGAWIYENEEEVGRAIRESMDEGVVTREEVFITAKLWNCFHGHDDVETGCRETLTALGLEFVDLYLMHWPIAFRPGTVIPQGPEGFWPLAEVPLAKTFETMLKLRDKGLAKSIGVSNFSVSKLEQLIAQSGVVPAVNQVELHPYNPQNGLLAYCRDKDIHLTAYSPLGSLDRPDDMKRSDEPPLLENQTVQAVAAEEGLTSAQLLIAWAVDRETGVIPKSTNPDRIAQNLAAASHDLSLQARRRLDDIDIRFRYIDPRGWFLPGVTYGGGDFWA